MAGARWLARTATSNALLNVNGRYNMAYSCWLSPSVFPIPYDQGDGKVTVTFASAVDPADIEDVQLYALDLDALGAASEELLSENAASVVSSQCGRIGFSNAG